MAKPSVIEARKAQAMQKQAEGLMEVNQKLDAIMEFLGMKDAFPVEPAQQEAPAEPEADALQVEAEVLDPAQENVEPEAEEPEAKPSRRSSRNK